MQGVDLESISENVLKGKAGSHLKHNKVVLVAASRLGRLTLRFSRPKPQRYAPMPHGGLGKQ
jgi:hypothetical protein